MMMYGKVNIYALALFASLNPYLQEFSFISQKKMIIVGIVLHQNMSVPVSTHKTCLGKK